MSKRTIVAMRGQPRTYNYLKQHTRRILDQVYGDYDFYWVSRQSSTVTTDEVLTFWGDHNPKLVSPAPYKHINGQRNQSYLDWELKQHIDWTTVKEVVFIRPDVYYIPQYNEFERLRGKLEDIGDWTITGWWINDPQLASVSDFYCQAGAGAAKRLCERHEADWVHLSDWIYAQQFETRSIPFNERLREQGNYSAWASRVIRPTALPYQPPPDNRLLNYDPDWDWLKKSEQQELCEQWRIDPGDYSLS
jgi:hypothetical protein